MRARRKRHPARKPLRLPGTFKPAYRTRLGVAYVADSLEALRRLPGSSVDLVLTSPPFALNRKKPYGNQREEAYVEWFLPFAEEIARVLKPQGSFVLELGGAWKPGSPVRSLYQINLISGLCKKDGLFHFIQDFYWYNPAKIPNPAQWVNVERIRVKDAVTPIFWLAKSERPKASNRHVLVPYSEAMQRLLERGNYNTGRRPSGHVISKVWAKNNGGAIPSNLIIASNTSSQDSYQRILRQRHLRSHPARFVEAVPDFFLRLLTARHDVVLDPFAGSNVVGAVAERHSRRWISIEIHRPYVTASRYRFANARVASRR